MNKWEEKTEKIVKQVLIVRKRIKDKKPDFKRQESWRYKRVKENWRRPRGIDSKMRKKVKGWPKSPSKGYRGPKIARGLHPSGYKEIRVNNADKIDDINPETQAIRIAHTVGMKKRVEITAKANEKGIYILNPKEEVFEETIDETGAGES